MRHSARHARTTRALQVNPQCTDRTSGPLFPRSVIGEAAAARSSVHLADVSSA
ncbi:hypothetical protein STRIP9103_07432 [Streptomyces ipomoeae 91-03]|uniref:Uncharacterized protein n=1 Tax=Streptomyces ipomoeae 91-03 TaxID=698759 RepID=L1KI13_9ACTN|nr:hypothetical protein STRIP9103_07432 [Streptomyces ipomoeae 91-03]